MLQHLVLSPLEHLLGVDRGVHVALVDGRHGFDELVLKRFVAQVLGHPAEDLLASLVDLVKLLEGLLDVVALGEVFLVCGFVILVLVAIVQSILDLVPFFVG